MSTQSQIALPFTSQGVQRHRESKRVKIEKLFMENLGRRFSSRRLHMEFGSSVRTRISEINRDELSEIRVHNETGWDEESQSETSVYWGARRG